MLVLATKVWPALYELKGQPWIWVPFLEVVEILGEDYLRPRHLWAAFFALSRLAPIQGVLKAVVEGKLVHLDEKGVDLNPDSEHRNYWDVIETGAIWVPAGWAMDVIRAYRLGVRSVMLYHYEVPPTVGFIQGVWYQGWNNKTGTYVVSICLDTNATPVNPPKDIRRDAQEVES